MAQLPPPTAVSLHTGDAGSSFTVVLLTITVLAAALLHFVPRVDNKLADGYRKFVALTTLGIAYLVLIALLVFTLEDLPTTGQDEAVLSLAVLAFLIFGLTLLYDVFDDWLRLFVDPEFNTLVEASMVLALVVLLLVVFLLVP